ncbi:hypothetical protein BRADI_4g12222v3 [Brachypodium distachyon]|uniref:Uncharacterized protein n=1 Tax=Brachypodium distachyon TaxID=15368 RepID=A0A2K2CMA3_BRADI|nr:hypothetical protein BRADI_4g12222v3 [Brachypodium distachyon]
MYVLRKSETYIHCHDLKNLLQSLTFSLMHRVENFHRQHKCLVRTKVVTARSHEDKKNNMCFGMSSGGRRCQHHYFLLPAVNYYFPKSYVFISFRIQ